MTEAQKEFIRIIHSKYLKSGLTVTKFANKIYVSPPALSYIFKGKRGIGFDLAFQMAEMLGIDLGQLQKKYKGQDFELSTKSIRTKKVKLDI